MELSRFSLLLDLPWPSVSAALLVLVILSYTFACQVDYETPVDFLVPIPEQINSGWKGEVLDKPSIKVPGSSGIQCYNPANGQLLRKVNPATPDGIDRAIARATEAQKEWAKTTFGQRRRVLRSMLKYILANQDAIATVACLDSGKTRVDAMLGEILVTVEKLKWTIKHGEKALKPERRPTNFLMMYKYNEVRWEPLGVLAACVSWKSSVPPVTRSDHCSQFHNLLSPIISTLFTGSALILKGSEQTAFSLPYFASIAQQALASCSHSPHLIQPLICWPQTAQHLTSHPSISHLLFIGSRPIAQHVSFSACRSLTPLCLELGGKDPAILLDSISPRLLHQIIPILLKGIFTSSGQNCIGIERIVAVSDTYDCLIPLLQKRIEALHPGDPLSHSSKYNIGAMISDSRFPHFTSLIQKAVSEGASLLVGGSQHHSSSTPKGHYFAPTLLVGVTPDMAIAQEELFAPIALLMPAASTAHAIQIANSTPYALGASVFADPGDRDNIETVVQGVKAGMVSVNDFGAYYATGLPFGGRGGSGYGRFGGEEGLRGICNVKAVCRDAQWAQVLLGGIGTRIPVRPPFVFLHKRFFF
ncbi:MAG: hypothetical protein Q9167_002325 [Letrouitia subvulpina]